MPEAYRGRVQWSGAPVTGPGVSTFYWSGVPTDTDVGAVRTFFNSVKGFFPPNISWSFPSVGDVIDVATGQLTGTWTTNNPVPGLMSGGAGNFAAGVGIRVAWETAGIAKGRRVRGSTYLVPITTAFYGADGTVPASQLATAQGAATVLLSDTPLFIYSRPHPEKADGALTKITKGTVPPKVSWLRSRRT